MKYFSLGLGEHGVHVFLAVLEHLDDGVLCDWGLGESRGEAHQQGWTLDREGEIERWSELLPNSRQTHTNE